MIELKIVTVPNCPHCVALHQALPGIRQQHADVAIEEVDATDPSQAEFLKEAEVDSTPFVLLYVDGELKGGDNFSPTTLMQLIDAVKEMQGAQAS